VKRTVDAEDLGRALVSLHEGWQDADAVTGDMLRAPRKRELGPVLARRNYSDARDKVVTALAYLAKLVSGDNGGPAETSGDGG
jgi:hypothetical protein